MGYGSEFDVMATTEDRYGERSRWLVHKQPFWCLYHFWAWNWGQVWWTGEERQLPLGERRVPVKFWPLVTVQLLAMLGVIGLLAKVYIEHH